MTRGNAENTGGVRLASVDTNMMCGRSIKTPDRAKSGKLSTNAVYLREFGQVRLERKNMKNLAMFHENIETL